LITIRPEQPGDRAGIHAVEVACFPTSAEAELVDALRDAGRLTLSLVAELAGELIGHVAFSPVSVEAGAVGAGLGPLAVLEGQRRQGVAARLVEEGLAACRAAGVGWVVVLGDPAYYSRFGFQPATAYGLCDEYGGGLAFQVLELVTGALPVGAGLVKYAPEFAAVA
jgi:putative acetyltransferase